MAKKRVDKALFTTVILLLGLGLVMVYSASAASAAMSDGQLFPGPFVKQVVAALIGLAAMLAVMHLDYHFLGRLWVVYALVAGVLALLVVVLLYGPLVNETRRWLFVGPVSVQPSELAKLVLIIFLAYQIAKKKDRINHAACLVPCGLIGGLMAFLVLIEPDFGTASILIGCLALMLFLAGMAWRYVVLAGFVLVPGFWFLVISVPYRRERLLAFLNPEADPLGIGFQPLQSLIAVGSGGILGLGLGESVQKLHFLPQANSDFIFAILCEELGLLGGLGLLALLAILLWRGIRAGESAPDRFGTYLAWGISVMLVVQALTNISVSLSLLPTTGTPLPLVSHGGSSLVTSLLACGMLLNVSEHG
jgi:cell division protein FtsW